MRFRLEAIRQSRLVRQNLVLFAGGMVAGFGGFVYHAVAGRLLAPALYGEVAALVAIYAVGGAGNLILILVLARYAAQLEATGHTSGLRYLATRSSVVLLVPAAACIVLTLLLAVPAAAFLNIQSPVPVIWAGVAIAVFWYAAIPRGILQGSQRFPALSVNLSLELAVRMVLLIALLSIGWSVTGSMIAIFLGVSFAYALGMWTLRDVLTQAGERVPLRSMMGFAVTATIGTVGVLLLYNLDVILAKHFLNARDAGLYGGLNKIGTIVYFGTLSISQVLFPRVIEAVHTNSHPARLLLLSAGLMCLLGGAAVLIFGLLPTLVVTITFASRFTAAAPYVLRIGIDGLGLSLINLLVQFLMAVHDRVFIPVLGGGVALLAVLIAVLHASLGQVVNDVVAAILLLLAALAIRTILLIPRLRPEMVDEVEEAIESAQAESV